jgi:acetolactate synthase-1/2/3 large subunit
MGLYTKGSFVVQDASQLIGILDHASELALAEPQGPVHVSIPKNVQLAEMVYDIPYRPNFQHPLHSFAQLDAFIQILGNSQQILAVLGTHDRNGMCRRFLKKYSIPTVTTLGAKGALSSTDSFYFGNYGFAGQAFANSLILSEEVDTLLLLDVNFNERNTFSWDARMVGGRRILALGSTWPKCFSDVDRICLSAPAHAVLEQLNDSKLEEALDSKKNMRAKWIEAKRTEKAQLGLVLSNNTPNKLNERFLIERFNELFPSQLLLVDAGMGRLAAGQFLQCQEGCFFTASDTAAMGWTLGAAIGACFARKSPVIVAIGDGSMLLQGNELATMQDQKLPILVLLLNNKGYQSVNNRQHSADRSTVKFPEIDWSQYTQSFSVSYAQASNVTELEIQLNAWKASMASNPGPMLIELIID